MMISLRPLDYDADLPRCVALMNDYDPGESVTESDLRDAHAKRLAEGIPFQEKTAVEETGAPVGFSYAGKRPWASATKTRLWILVDPTHRRSGVGSALLEDALTWARVNGFEQLYVQVRDDDPESRAFAEKRGFVVERHRFLSQLDTEAFDETPFLPVLAEKEAEGIRFASLAGLGETDENRRKLYALNLLAAADEPANDGSVTPFEEFSRMVFEAPWFRADGQILALDGDNFIGLAAVGQSPQMPDTMFNAFTGTHPSYRSRKIALALKLLTIRLARESGVVRIRTNNDSLNPAMLAINGKLGYVRQPGRYTLQRNL